MPLNSGNILLQSFTSIRNILDIGLTDYCANETEYDVERFVWTFIHIAHVPFCTQTSGFHL